MYRENIVSQVLFFIGIIQIIFGFFCGLVFGNDALGYSEFSWSVFFTWLAVGFVSGMLFIGLAEVIKILHDIRLTLITNSDKVITDSNSETVDHNLDLKMEEDATSPDNTMAEPKFSWKLNDSDIGKIELKYHKKNIAFISQTPYEGYCIVGLKGNDEYKIVDINGFAVSEVKDKSMIKKINEWYENEI